MVWLICTAKFIAPAALQPDLSAISVGPGRDSHRSSTLRATQNEIIEFGALTDQILGRMIQPLGKCAISELKLTILGQETDANRDMVDKISQQPVVALQPPPVSAVRR